MEDLQPGLLLQEVEMLHRSCNFYEQHHRKPQEMEIRRKKIRIEGVLVERTGNHKRHSQELFIQRGIGMNIHDEFRDFCRSRNLVLTYNQKMTASFFLQMNNYNPCWLRTRRSGVTTLFNALEEFYKFHQPGTGTRLVAEKIELFEEDRECK